jgi:predicted dithiol-disulfide oxidoreductase (DUF899 family)
MTRVDIAKPEVVSREKWLENRLRLLEHEKEHTKQYDKLNAELRRLPMVKLDKEYEFEGPNGTIGLADLFEGRRQLIIYHFMFDPSWEKGCHGCTGLVNALGDISMLAERNTTFSVISRAPFEKLETYKIARGWDIPWFSSFGTDFNYDFHVTLDKKVAPVEYNFKNEEELTKGSTVPLHEGEAHGMSVFFNDDENIYHTYSAYARGTESRTDSYRLLDITPYGRQEDFEESPAGWPQKPTYG